MRVLIVDDEPELARALARLIGASGHSVVVALTALDAVAESDKERVDVALVDWELRSTMTGVDVARHIRKRWPQAATVLCSGYSLQHMRAGWTDPLTGMLTFFEKPIDSEKLQRLLRVVQDSLADTKP